MATILIVDDRPSNRQFLTTLLGYGGHRMLEAEDGERALDAVRAERPALVITDILMPKMDGYEFVQRMRAEPAFATTPVIFYTATYSSPQAETLARSCGVRTVLSKPCEPQAMLAAVNRELGIGDQGGAAPLAGSGVPPGMAARRPDDTLNPFLKDLDDVKQRFEDIAAQSSKLPARRDAVKEMSRQFSENVSSMQRVTIRLSALLEVGMELMSERDPRRLVELFFAATCDLIDSSYAAVGMLDESEKEINVVFAKGFDGGILRGDAGRKGLLGSLLSGQRTLRARASPDASGEEGLPSDHPKTHNLLGVPVASADRVYGWMYFADKRGKEGFTEEDTRLLNAMTRKLALLYENAMLYDVVQRSSAELHIEVSERRRAQHALREREAGLHRAQVIARLAHVITTADGSFESWSDTLPPMLGMQADAMPRSTREWLDIVHPEDRENFRAKSIETGRTGARFECEYRLKGGGRSWIHIRQVSELLDRSGHPTGKPRWFGTLQDVTEQKLAEGEQRSMRQLLDNIVDNIPTAVQLKSVQDDFRVVMWNKAAEAMYGLPREDAIGRNMHDLWPRADAERFHAADLELVKSGATQDFPDRAAQTKDRGEIRVHMRKVVLSDASGKATHLLAIADDITSQLADQARLRESEERFRSLSMLSSDWFWEQDAEHRFVKFSGGEGVKGWGPDQNKAIGLHRWDLGGVIPISCGWEEHKGMLDAHKPFRGFEYKRVLGDGRLQYVEASGEPIFDAAGRFTGYRGVATEITLRKEAENRIKRLNRVYAVLSSINSLIVRVRDRGELFREACRIAVEQGGFGMAWIGEFDPATLDVTPVAWHGMDESAVSMKATARADSPGGQGMVGRAIRAKAPVITNDIDADPGAGGPRRAEALRKGFHSIIAMPLIVDGEVKATLTLFARERDFFSDEEMKLLTELAGDIAFAIDNIEKRERLDYLALYDQLTGLANRGLLCDRLDQLIRAAGRAGSKVAVAKLDLERMRSINESLGRQAGDEVHKELAARLSRALGASPIGRVSANHFAVALEPIKGRSQAERKIQEILRACFEAPFHVNGSELRLAAKCGIALFPNDGADAETLLGSAEAALRKAKEVGERHVFYTRDMTEHTGAKLTLESKLRQALEKEEFVLHYQPKVDLVTRRIVGVEALMRWQSAELGLVPPAKFIPLMEETGMILEAGAWALQRAARDHRGWVEQKLPAPRVAVNVSAIQLRKRDFVAAVERAIMEGVAPTGIDLEITESLIMEDVEVSIQKLKEIRTLGLSVAIDDFGTGYSSLAYLSKLPLATLKIDRAFIVNLLDDPDTATLVQMMITLAHTLKLKVVAEGVETEEQARLLRLLKCDQMQGYLFSKPLPLEALTALLKKAG